MIRIVCDRCKKDCTNLHHSISILTHGRNSEALRDSLNRVVSIANANEKHYCPDCIKKVEKFLKDEGTL